MNGGPLPPNIVIKPISSFDDRGRFIPQDAAIPVTETRLEEPAQQVRDVVIYFQDNWVFLGGGRGDGEESDNSLRKFYFEDVWSLSHTDLLNWCGLQRRFIVCSKFILFHSQCAQLV